MDQPTVPVVAILRRLPQRAQTTYWAYLHHPGTAHDPQTGWSYAYISQDHLAGYMGCALRTVNRAVADLRAVGVLRVLAWPNASTETSLRVSDVPVPPSVFGPVARIDALNPERLVEAAICKLVQEYDEILWDIELAYADYSE